MVLTARVRIPQPMKIKRIRLILARATILTILGKVISNRPTPMEPIGQTGSSGVKKQIT